MFHCSVGTQSYAEIYEACTGYSVKMSPELPNKICSECETALISFHNFRLNVEFIEERLQVYHSLLDSQQSGIQGIEKNENSAEDFYADEYMLVEAIDDDEFSVLDDESQPCSIIEAEANQDKQTDKCYFIPLEPTRKRVSCKLHEKDCELQETINDMKPDQAIPITCECGVILKNRRSFLKHYSTIHASNSSRMKCKICSETFASWRSKMAHEANVHSIGLKYVCSNCEKKFYRSDHWKVGVAFLTLLERKA